jgi:hypothetical protein
LTVCRVFRLTNQESLDEVSCLMMLDTRLYLNWIPNTLIADEDKEFELTSEDDTLAGRWGYYAFSRPSPRITEY